MRAFGPDGVVDLLFGLQVPPVVARGARRRASGEGLFEDSETFFEGGARMERVLLETRRCMRTMRKPM